MRNRTGIFSVERLMQFLTALGQDVEISVRPTRKQDHVPGLARENISEVRVARRFCS